MTSSFKSFGYRFQTQQTRVGMDTSSNLQQIKAGIDAETQTQQQITQALKKAQAAQKKIAAKSYNGGKKRRFIM